MKTLDLQYCSNLINALICIQKSIKKDKSIEIVEKEYDLRLSVDPDRNWLDLTLVYRGITDFISISIHDASEQQSDENLIRVFKRVNHVFDEAAYRYKAFYSLRDSDTGMYSLIGFDEKTIQLAIKFDEEDYFQLSTVYNLPPKEYLFECQNLYDKLKQELPLNSVVRLSYLSQELNENMLDEITKTIYGLVPIFKIS